MIQEGHQSGAAGSATFSGSDSRRYNYFAPEGKRATLYEDVTVDVQPDPSRHLLQGWIMTFANGQPTYGAHTTAAQCADWHVFRAADQEWSRTHYQRQSHIENTIRMVVENARSDGAPGRFDQGWVAILQNQFGALKHAEFGLGVALMKAQRDGMTQMVNNAILTNASYKLRLAQDITLYLGDIGLDSSGATLVGLRPIPRELLIWDLRAIRARLKTMNLDWELQPIGRSVPPGWEAANEFIVLQGAKQN